MKKLKPLNKFWNRSPFFYKLRYKLLLKDISISELQSCEYNTYNPKHLVPEIYFETNNEIFSNTLINLDDFEKAITIAKWLRKELLKIIETKD